MKLQGFAQKIRDQQGSGNGEEHDIQRFFSNFDDVEKVHAESKQNDRILQYFFRCVFNARIECRRPFEGGDGDADQDAEYGPSNDGEGFAQKPCWNRDDQTY
ncbi:hypothetical protein SDC9_124040 [bioreactor metagenome]|uniref:Uncharacterized protein n=1 Tax=bioreactor metagenome TaxID=1076179 RepID=A0A645CJB7_9ZZZZ